MSEHNDTNSHRIVPFPVRMVALAGLLTGLVCRGAALAGYAPAIGVSFFLAALAFFLAAAAVRFGRANTHGRLGRYIQDGAYVNALFLIGAYICFPEHAAVALVHIPLAALFGGAGAALTALLLGRITIGIGLPMNGGYAVIAGALFGIGVRVVFSGEPGSPFSPMNLSFIALSPLAVGAVTVYVAERRARRSWSYYYLSAMLANAFFIAGTMLILIEGLICAILILPLFAIYGALGGIAMGALCRFSKWPRHGVYSFALLPLALAGLAPAAPDEVFVGRQDRTIVIDAAPARIWQQLHDTRNISPAEVERAWMYRIGVPLPESGVTRITPSGHERTITMGKSIRFTQVATEWEENRRVRWTYRFDADSIPPGALDDHVKIGGHYFDLIDTVYTLTPTQQGATELTISMHYRVSTQYNWYTKRVAQLLIVNLEGIFLEFYKHRAEQAAPVQET